MPGILPVKRPESQPMGTGLQTGMGTGPGAEPGVGSDGLVLRPIDRQSRFDYKALHLQKPH